MSTEFSKRDEATAVFGRARPLIDVTLRREFRLSKADAQQLEEDMGLWFSRFVLRGGSREHVESERRNLFLTTCKAARIYWDGKLEGKPVADERLKRALNRDPQEMAEELEQKQRAREARQARLKPKETPS